MSLNVLICYLTQINNRTDPKKIFNFTHYFSVSEPINNKEGAYDLVFAQIIYMAAKIVVIRSDNNVS